MSMKAPAIEAIEKLYHYMKLLELGENVKSECEYWALQVSIAHDKGIII